MAENHRNYQLWSKGDPLAVKWSKFWPFLSRKSHHPIETLFLLFGVQQEIRNYIKNNTMDTIKTQREERDK